MTSADTNSLTLIQPDDWHIHLRDGDALPRTVNDAARQFKRVIVMPNLVPPVTEPDEAAAYRERIIQSLYEGVSLDPLMVLYLTDNTRKETVANAKKSGIVQAFKWYPAGATTNSQSGVTSLAKIYPALEAMQAHDIVLSVHGEVTDPQVDIFDREARFIEDTLEKVASDFPALRIVLEHITTRQAVDFVSAASANIAATITAHHLLFNRNDMLVGGIRPHYFCLPILKREEHRRALVNAAIGDDPKFFLGTDSAPHAQHRKENACGCAGVYSAFSAIELYAEAFDRANALDKLEAFASFYGPDFYQLPRNQNTIELLRQPWTLPQSLPVGADALIPCQAGETLAWQLK